MKQKHKRLSLLALTLLALSLFLAGSNTSVYQASGADGANGTLSFGYNEYIPGSSYLIIMSDLDVSSDYTLDFTAGCASQFNFTTGASETEIHYRVTLESPTSGTECLITLESQSDGVALDTIRTQGTGINTIINRDNLISLIMLVMVILFVLGVAVTIFRKIA